MMENQDIAEKLKPIFERHGVTLAYLFGSAARGTMGPHSDIDVGVVFDENIVPFQKQFSEKLAIASEMEREFEIENADVINLNQQRNPVLRYEVVLEGRTIFVKDPGAKAQLTRAVLREYENTRYLRETSYRILREQIKSGEFGRAPLHHKKYVTHQ